MPTITSSAELRNSYNAVSKQCHESGEPIFITKNGKGDLVVQSIESYEEMQGRLDFYRQIAEGMSDIEKGDAMPFDEAMKALRAGRRV
jgi:prevent-host-death family protein